MSLKFEESLSFQENIDRLTSTYIRKTGRVRTTHLQPIIDLHAQLGLADDRCDLQNALYLARCLTPDLLIVLQNPSEGSCDSSELDMVNSSQTLDYINDSLDYHTGGQHNIENTAVLDMQLLRPESDQMLENDEEREENNALAFDAFKRSVEILQPKVILLCHCRSRAPDDGLFEKAMQSSMATAGTYFRYADENLEYTTTVVRAFHPSTFLRYQAETHRGREITEDESDCLNHLQRLQFDMCLVMALQSLRGKRVTNLYDFNGACSMRLTPAKQAVPLPCGDDEWRVCKIELVPADSVAELASSLTKMSVAG